MKIEEIKKICVKNNLTCIEAYDIRSQITSICKISEHKLMFNASCLEDNRKIINERLLKAFMHDLIDIRALGCSLGKQKLDYSIMNIKL